MRVVVADATPLHYLILIGAVEILPRLFEKIHVPTEIREELSRNASPPAVRTWMQQPPEWLVIDPAPAEDASLAALDAGDLPSSAGEKRMLRLAASLAGQAPVSLGDAITGIDKPSVGLLIKSVQHAAGRRQFP